MKNTAKQHLSGVPDDKTKNPLGLLFEQVACQMATQSVRTAGLVITATAGKKVPKIGAAAYYGTVNGRLVTVAAGTDMPALSGTVANAAFNVYCFFIDAASTVTSVMGTAGASLLAVRFPDFPVNKALVGFVIINPTGTGDFVGNTTALDDATVAPNAVYVSPVGAFNPTFIY